MEVLIPVASSQQNEEGARFLRLVLAYKAATLQGYSARLGQIELVIRLTRLTPYFALATAPSSLPVLPDPKSLLDIF